MRLNPSLWCVLRARARKRAVPDMPSASVRRFLVLLTALRSFSALTPDGFCISCSKHVDGCIVKGGIRYDLLRHVIMLCQQMHISLVETQNLASHEQPIPTCARNSMSTTMHIPPCETQDFASLLLQTAYIIHENINHTQRRQPCWVAKSCVSRAAHTNTIIQYTAGNNSICPLVRRKILRLYFSGSEYRA